MIDVFAEDAVEDEQLLALSGVDSQTCRSGDGTCRTPESLRDKLISWVCRLQRRSNAYSYELSAGISRRLVAAFHDEISHTNFHGRLAILI